MLSTRSRTMAQVGIILGYILVSLIVGWACDGGSTSSNLPPSNTGMGSDHKKEKGKTTQDVALAELPGVVERYQDWGVGTGQVYDAKDLAFFKEWVQGDMFIGLQIPTAADASQPGELTGTAKIEYITFSPFKIYSTTLVTDPEAAGQLADLVPPDSQSRWEAVRAQNFDFISSIPSISATVKSDYAMIYYVIDFKGTDYCNGCPVKQTFCFRSKAISLERLALHQLMPGQVMENSIVSCNLPQKSYINLTEYDQYHDPIKSPGPVVAAFGLWGHPTSAQTLSSQVAITYTLEHTSETTRTLTLSPIQSRLGYNYQWQDLQGNVISQVQAGKKIRPFSTYEQVVVKGSNLPTCSTLKDTIYLTATMVMTPSIQATAWTDINMLPDPAQCNTADVGLTASASSGTLTPGDWMTQTMVITNYASAAQTVAMTGTFSVPQAFGNFHLPAGCAQDTTGFHCTISNIAAGKSVQLRVGLQASALYSGLTDQEIQVQPIGKVDGHQYDNAVHLVTAIVSPTTKLVYLPLVKNRH